MREVRTKRRKPIVPPRRRRRPPPTRQRAASPRRISLLTPALGVLAAGAVAVAWLSVGSSSATSVSQRTVPVTRGVAQSIVSGSGNLAPARQLDVDFQTSGRITHIYTRAGRHVEKGELLARLDPRSAQVAVSQAHATLADDRAKLDAIVNPAPTPTPTPTPSSGRSASSSTPSSGLSTSSSTPSSGLSASSSTPSSGPSASSSTPSSGPSASSSTTTTATATPSPAGEESAQADVDSAQLALDQAEADLDATELRAPIAATVASVTGEVGDTVGGSPSGGSSSAAASSGGGAGGSGASGGSTASASTSSGFIVLAQLSRLTMDVQLSESDISKVHVGQAATVSVNAASGEEVAAHVSAIGVLAGSSSSGTGSSSAVSYPVTVTLGQSTPGLKPGMSATADIVTAQASGLTVPNQALRGSTVTVERNGRRSTQRVATGVAGDTSTQIVSGLQAGDQVVITSTTATLGRLAGNAQQQSGRGALGAGAGAPARRSRRRA